MPIPPEPAAVPAGHPWDSLPNALSLVRLALGCCFPWFPVGWRWAVVLIAALTDLGDGALSRRWHVSGSLG